MCFYLLISSNHSPRFFIILYHFFNNLFFTLMGCFLSFTHGVYIKFLLSNSFNNQIGNSHLLLLIFKSTRWESFNSLYTFLKHECHLFSLCPCIIQWRPLHLQLCNIKYFYARLNYAGWVGEGLCASFHVLPSLPYQYFLIAWYHFKYFLVVTNFSFSHLCMVNDDWFGKYHLNVELPTP